MGKYLKNDAPPRIVKICGLFNFGFMVFFEVADHDSNTHCEPMTRIRTKIKINFAAKFTFMLESEQNSGTGSGIGRNEYRPRKPHKNLFNTIF